VQQQVHQLLDQVQQQEWQWQQQQLQQPVPGGTPDSGSVDELISALRRVTSNGRRSTGDAFAAPVPAVTPAAARTAAAVTTITPAHSHQRALQQQQQQKMYETPVARSAGAAGIGVVPSFGSMRHMNSSVDELIGALQRVADSSRRGTAEAAAAGMRTPGEQQQQQQQQQGGGADGALFGSFSNVDDLIVALRRATSDNARTASSAQGTTGGNQRFVTPQPQQQQQQRRRPWEQAATTPQQQQQARQVMQQNSPYAADGPLPVTPSNVDELILALRRATGDSSRRSTAEAVPSPADVHRWEPQQLWMGQQQESSQPGGQGLQAGSLFGSMGSLGDLLGALRRATGDSRRGTAESAPDAQVGCADTAAAALDAAAEYAAPTTRKRKQKAEQDHVGFEATPTAAKEPAGLFGSLSSVDDLLGALWRATDSRRGTAESAPDAAAGTDDTAAAAAAAAAAGITGQLTAMHGNAAAVAEPADLFGSFSSVDDLLGALRRATDSRRGTAESAPDAAAGTADTAAGCVAAKQKASVHHSPGTAAAAAETPVGLFGSLSSVDDLLCALRRATDSRRGTAESAAPDAAAYATTAGMPPAAAATAAGVVVAYHRGEEESSGTGASAAEAGPAGLHGSFSSVDDLIQALRSTTADGRRGAGELLAGPGVQAAAAAHSSHQQREVADELVQQSTATRDADRLSSLGSASLEDVLGALLRASTSGNRRGTAEAVAEAAAVPLDSQQQQQQQHSRSQLYSTQDSQQPSTAAYSPVHMSGNSINQLVSSLRRVTAETQGKLRAAADATLPQPPMPAAAGTQIAAADAAAAAASTADMHDLVAALRRVTRQDQAAGCSSTGIGITGMPSSLLLTPQTADQALNDVHHEQEQQQQRQQDALIQQLLLQTQPGEVDEQLHFQQQQQAGSGSFLKAAWGSGGGDEASAVRAAGGDAATSSGGVEQLLVALRGTAVAEGVPAKASIENELLGQPEQGAEVQPNATSSSAMQLAILLQGQQQQQQAASSGDTTQAAGASSCRTPDAPAVLGSISAACVAALAQQQEAQQSPGAAAALDMSQSPLRARQLLYGEASPGAAAGDSSQPQLSFSQLVHALQYTGDQCTGRVAADAAAPPSPAALEVHSGAATTAAEDGTARSLHHVDAIATADGAARDSNMYRFPTSSSNAEEQLQAAAESPPLQQEQQQTAAEPAEAAAESHQQQQQAAALTPAGENTCQQQASSNTASSAAAGLQSCSLSSMAVAFDPRIAAELRQELAAAVVAAGGCVAPGRPHLGCGANTVVAEPQHAAQWLQLLMHIVSPAWLLKACRQQQQQGCRPQQQLMCLSPDVARALGQGRQHQQDDGAAADGGSSRRAAHGEDHCSNATSPTGDTVAALIVVSSSTALQAANAQAPGDSSSKVCRSVLAVPAGGLSVDGMGLCGASAADGASDNGQQQQQQQQPPLMPPGLLEGVVWSVDQDPRCVQGQSYTAPPTANKRFVCTGLYALYL
jgi:hypothetical protein